MNIKIPDNFTNEVINKKFPKQCVNLRTNLWQRIAISYFEIQIYNTFILKYMLILIAGEKCKTKLMSKIMILVVVVSYIWIDQLIRIAREKYKTKLMSKIMMLVVSYIWIDQLIRIAWRSARPS